MQPLVGLESTIVAVAPVPETVADVVPAAYWKSMLKKISSAGTTPEPPTVRACEVAVPAPLYAELLIEISTPPVPAHVVAEHTILVLPGKLFAVTNTVCGPLAGVFKYCISLNIVAIPRLETASINETPPYLIENVTPLLCPTHDTVTNEGIPTGVGVQDIVGDEAVT